MKSLSFILRSNGVRKKKTTFLIRRHHSFGALNSPPTVSFLSLLKFKLTRSLTHSNKGGRYRTLSLSQGDQFRDTDHQRQKLQSSNKKWHLPPVFSTLLFWNSKYQKEKSSKMCFFEDQWPEPVWYLVFPVFSVCVWSENALTHTKPFDFDGSPGGVTNLLAQNHLAALWSD